MTASEAPLGEAPVPEDDVGQTPGLSARLWPGERGGWSNGPLVGPLR